MDIYDLGDLVRVSGAFTDSAGAAQDPNAVLFSFTDPSGNTSTYTYGVDVELVKDDTGDYHVDVDCDECGVFWWRWYSTGSGQAADEGRFYVQQSAFD